MTIMITGATGFIGQHLAKKLLEEQHSLILLTRNPQQQEALQQPGVKVVAWDAKTLGEWARYLSGVDAIVNLTGESIGGRRWTTAQKDRILISRVDSTRAIVEAISQAPKKPSVLVNASAVGYYGDVKDRDVTESNPRGNDFLASVCEQWENTAKKAEQYGVRVVLVRSGVVLDKRGGALQRMALPFKLFVGGTLGSGNQWFPWIHIDDEVAAIKFAVENPNLSGPVNLAAPEAATMKQFCAALGKEMGRPLWAPVPAFVLKIVLGEMSSMILTGQRVVPKKLLDAGFRFRFGKLEEALRDVVRS